MSSKKPRTHRSPRLVAWAALASVLAGCADPGEPPLASQTRAALPPPCCESPPPYDTDAAPSDEDPPPPPPPPPVNQPPHDVMTVPAAEVDRAAFLAVTALAQSPLLDVLAGVAVELEAQHPAWTQADYAAALASAWSTISAAAPPATIAGGGLDARIALRVLHQVIPTLGNTPAAQAIRAYTGGLLAALRDHTDELSQVSPLDTLASAGAASEHTRASWEKLHQRARANPAFAAAVDGSPAFAVLGASTGATATAIVAAHDLPVLSAFVTAHVAADGSITATTAELTALVDAATGQAMAFAGEVKQHLFAINDAEEQYLTVTQVGTGGTSIPPSDAVKEQAKQLLKAAIQQAETKKTTYLGPKLGKVVAATEGALKLAGFLAKQSQYPALVRLGRDVKQLASALKSAAEILKFADEAVQTAKRLAGVLELGKTTTKVIGASLLTGGVVAAVFSFVSIMGDDSAPITPSVLASIKQLRNLVLDIREEMQARFDRVDSKLNAIYDEMIDQFAEIDWDLGVINGNVEEVQAALTAVHADLNRLDRNIYSFLDDLSRMELVEGIAFYLGYEERLGNPLPAADFAVGESLFYTWAEYHSSNSIQAGPPSRSYADSALLTELSNYPMATNINYLSQLPAVKFGLPALSSQRLANPYAWIVAGESYAQLGEENPDDQAAVSPLRLNRVRNVGGALSGALTTITSPALFDALDAHYLLAWEGVIDAVHDAEAAFEADPARRLKGIDLFSGPDQRPSQHALDGWRDLPACRAGRDFGSGRLTLPTNLATWSHQELTAYMNAGNLGLGVLDGCLYPEWVVTGYTESAWGWFYHYALRVTVRVRYSGATVATHSFLSALQLTKLVRWNDPPFDPNVSYAPETKLGDNWPIAGAWTNAVTATPAQLAAVRAAVDAHLDLLQRAFYGEVASRMTLAGDALNLAGAALSGSRKMYESYVSLGLPLSMEQNDTLRGLVLGGQSIFGGSDAGDDDGLLNDVEDLYAYFASQTSGLPQENIVAAIDDLARERAAALREAIGDILADIDQNDAFEANAPLLPTLTRLSLLATQSP